MVNGIRDGIREKIDTAKRWGGSIVIPLTGYIEEGKRYIIKKSVVNIEGKDRNCVVIFEDKTSIPNIRVVEAINAEIKEKKI